MNEWISVKDRLPEKNNWKVYAVLTTENHLRKHQIAWFQYTDKTFRLENDPNRPIKVTHWFSLPDITCIRKLTKDGLNDSKVRKIKSGST